MVGVTLGSRPGIRGRSAFLWVCLDASYLHILRTLESLKMDCVLGVSRCGQPLILYELHTSDQ